MLTILRLLDGDECGNVYIEQVERDLMGKIVGVLTTHNAFKACNYNSPSLLDFDEIEELSYLSTYFRDQHSTMLEFVTVLQ
jgi:hypothetical protein